MEVRESRVRALMDQYRLGQISYELMWAKIHRVNAEYPEIPPRDAWKAGYDYAFNLVKHEIDWLEKEKDGTTPFMNKESLNGRDEQQASEDVRGVET